MEAVVPIPILDDSVEEDTEMFTVMLSTNEPNVMFGADIATVTITDDDGKELLFFHPMTKLITGSTLQPGQLPCDHILRRLPAFAHLFTHCNCIRETEWTEWVATSRTSIAYFPGVTSQCPSGITLTYEQRRRKISGDCSDEINNLCVQYIPSFVGSS